MSDWYPDFDRLEVDLHQDAQTSPPTMIRVCVDRTCLNNDDRLKLLANLKLARAWLTESGPENVAFEYETLG